MVDPATMESCVFAGPNGPYSPETEGFIHTINKCSTKEGPGERYVIYLKGCPLRCQYYHSPEAQGKAEGEAVTARAAFAEVVESMSRTSGGGLTLSGGEPLMQPAFVHAMFAMAKTEGIHTALDTSGFVGHKAGDELLDLTDLVLLDIKSFSPMTHKLVTGV